ncbi:14651_t:CDS:2, partial [Ambispora leptoticha]
MNRKLISLINSTTTTPPPTTHQTWDTIPQKLLNDLGQLVKANSIEGVKRPNVVVVYTPWKNLKKTGEMDVGQVSFHNP